MGCAYVPPLLPRGLDVERLVGGGHLPAQVLLVPGRQVALVLELPHSKGKQTIGQTPITPSQSDRSGKRGGEQKHR
jgi:hypothetical protein